MRCMNPCRWLALVSTLTSLATLAAVVGVVQWAQPHIQAAKDAVQSAQSDLPAALVMPSLAQLQEMALGTHEQLEATFKTWMDHHKKSYADKAEYKRRLANFATSAKTVFEHNSRLKRGSDEHYMGLTSFADMTDDEFMEHFNLKSVKLGQECSATAKSNTEPGKSLTKPANPSNLALPPKVDWREKGVVTPVKNQGHCGSCWTFSTTGTLEAHLKMKTGKTVSLSEQQLIDCAGAFDNHGCNGGLPSHAFEYIAENGGLDTEKAYPYEAHDNKCRFHKWGVGGKVAGVMNITQFDEKELQAAIAFAGPVAVAFQVTGSFRLYAGGVYSEPNCKNGPQDVNHAVVAVGYDTTGPVSSYIIKNSWGEGWGMSGYFQMGPIGANMCGVADCASYPLL